LNSLADTLVDTLAAQVRRGYRPERWRFGQL